MWNLKNKLNCKVKHRQTHKWRADDSGGGGSQGMEGLSKKIKGLMDLDNSVVIVGEGG